MGEAQEAEPRRLSDFLRENRERILQHWEREVRGVRAAATLERPVLLDHMPHFLEDLAGYVSELRTGHEVSPPEQHPRIHALERLAVGYDLSEVVEEYAVLRRCITELAAQMHTPALRSAELPLLHSAIDQAIATSVTRYTEARERTLRALDRISSAALVHHDVASLMPTILDAFLGTTAAVDSVALVLGSEELRVHAAAGFPEPGPQGKVVGPDSFSARVAREGELMVRDAALDEAISASPTCAPGTHALYGLPLVLGQQQLGVAVMGSRSSREFSQEDQFLFRTLVQRLAALIAQARLSAELRQRASELEVALDFRDRILGVLSHDLRNPLGVILTSAELLLRNTQDERQRRGLERLRLHGRQVERMIHDLLDYTRARNGQSLPLAPRRVDLTAICQPTLDGLQLLHPERPLRLTAQGDAQARLDPDRAAQVIGNLVGNAVLHGAPGTPVQVLIRGEADAVVLEVRNQGEPIAPELLPRLFEAFRRGAGEEGSSPGLGLGLYIVQQIVAGHGGSVGVVSTPEAGTVFTVRWPR